MISKKDKKRLNEITKYLEKYDTSLGESMGNNTFFVSEKKRKEQKDYIKTLEELNIILKKTGGQVT